MNPLHFDLTDLLERCRTALLDAEPTPVAHNDLKDLRNNRLPETLRSRSINVYAIWARKRGTSSWTAKYIGQRTARSCWARVCEHLFHVHAQTESKLEQVRAALHDGFEIGVTGILVEPDSLRLTIEDELIRVGSREPEALAWNTRSRARRTNGARRGCRPTK